MNNSRVEATRRIAVVLSSRIVVLGFQFLSLVLIGRRLGPASFGTLQVAWAVFTYVGLVGEFGSTIVGTREIAAGDTRGIVGSIVGLRLGLSLLAASSVMLGGWLLGFGAADLALLAALGLGTVVASLNTRWLAQGRERFVVIAASDIAGAAAQVVMALTLVTGPRSLFAAGLVLVCPMIVSTSLLLMDARPRNLIVPRLGRATIDLLRIAAPLGLSALAIQLYYNADTVMIGVFRGSAEAGWYGAAYRLVYAALAVPVAVHNVVLPMLARLLRHDPAAVHRLLRALSRGLLFIAIAFAVAATLTADFVIPLVFGQAFAPAAAPLAILSWVTVTVSANAPFAALMLGRGQDRAYLVTAALGSLVNVGANLIVIPRFGMVGAAWTTLAEEAVVLALIIWYTRDESSSIVIRAVLAVAPSAAAMAIAITLVGATLPGLVVGAVAFVVVGILTKVLPIAPLGDLARSFGRG